MQYLEDENQNFWCCEINGNQTIIRTGIRTGDISIMTHASVEGARAFLSHMVSDQLQIGFKAQRTDKTDAEGEAPSPKKQKVEATTVTIPTTEAQSPPLPTPPVTGDAEHKKHGVVDKTLFHVHPQSNQNYSVCDDYHCTLNLANIAINCNKFFVIQVLADGNQFYMWARWGRVGEPGRCKLTKCTTKAEAVTLFEKKFWDKTGNKWKDRHNFTPKTNKYHLLVD
eukprot:TRINITY_DN67632_c7_g1_i1.p1 TRINITY_DN67632_c7_g1~~TRINITY_DN67632_c7_g1_i1.p1  ORF type:complete len:225 (-),score=19.38 TRINITY_DN67632_c7_g1_i1:522-1196(-)